MIAELGQFALSVALVMALLQAALPLYGAHKNIPAWMAAAKPLAYSQLFLLTAAFASLTYCFVTHDFSVAYVATHSNRSLPLLYRISGVWGGHEGSLLLWSLILALWGGAVARFTRRMPAPMTARALAVMAMIGGGFLAFILFTSNPFTRLLPAPLVGRDLNPLLQDIGLAVHPPMLYIGYVGFSVVFAFTIAALLGGRLDAAWARWSRPWCNLAWVFLTLGITLGSWWAYYELGWGGWWFWDPVENASFMPWLAGTALLHSLAATEKRGVFKAWSALLAVLTFSLSLLGAFLVRSGVLTSVHAFATDPARGLFVLIFLAVICGASLALYAWRAPRRVSPVRFALLSREMALLLNNILLGALCFSVLLGTLYPLLLEAVSGVKISVGAPYFNFMFAVIGAPLAVCIGIGAWLRWKKHQLAHLPRSLSVAALLSLAAGLALPLLSGKYSFSVALGLTLGIWIMLTTLAMLWARTARGARLRDFAATPPAVYGMALAHIGVGVLIIGVAVSNAYSVEKDVRIAAGETFSLAGYDFQFNGTVKAPGANYESIRGEFLVRKNQQLVATLYPEKRTYLVMKTPMTEAAIDPGFTRDLYVALGEPLDDSAWAVRLYYKPLLRWIWLGALLMALGGLIAAADHRYRPLPRRERETEMPLRH